MHKKMGRSPRRRRSRLTLNVKMQRSNSIRRAMEFPQGIFTMSQLLLKLLLGLLLFFDAVQQQVKAAPTVAMCPTVMPTGWFSNGVFKGGVPPPVGSVSFLPVGVQGSTTSSNTCLLEMLQSECVNIINQFRSGARTFSDGTRDPSVPLPPLTQAGGQRDVCSNEQVMGDLVLNVQQSPTSGSCAGTHVNDRACPGFTGSSSQNSCCGMGGLARGTWDTYAYLSYNDVLSGLTTCLQTMWDEGQGGVNANKMQSHWQVMRSTALNFVSCGFAWADSGRVMMEQNFGQAYTPQPPTPAVPTTAPPPTARPKSAQPTVSPTRRPTRTRPTPPSRKPTGSPSWAPTPLPTMKPTKRRRRKHRRRHFGRRRRRGMEVGLEELNNLFIDEFAL